MMWGMRGVDLMTYLKPVPPTGPGNHRSHSNQAGHALTLKLDYSMGADHCLIFVPFGHYDEPKTLPYENPSICPRGVDVRHCIGDMPVPSRTTPWQR